MSTEIRTTKVNCRDCGVEFESVIVNLLGVNRPLRHFCRECTDIRDRAEKERQFLEHQAAEKARQDEISRTRRRWRETCGIPPKFMTSEFGTFEATRQAKAYKRCLEYAQGFNPGQSQGYPSLLMFSAGSWGVGKSHLSCAIIHHVLNKWDGVPKTRPVLFITEPKLFVRLKATFNVPDADRTWRETEDDVMRELTTVPLLVLDDVGKMEQSEMRFVQRTLFAVIDGRYSNQLPMVITANLDGQGIREHLGAGRGNEASFDRLVEMTGGKFLEMKGASYRRNTK